MPINFLHKHDLKWAYQWINDDGISPVILFLHEGLGSIAQWKSFPEKLCELSGFSGLVYDRQGYGKSSKLSSKRDHRYLHNYALEELPVIIDSLISQERELYIYGHSDGGSIALIYAAQYPEKVSGVITEAAHVIVEDITLAGIKPVVTLFEQGSLSSKLEVYHGDKTKEIFYAWSDTWHLKRFREWDITEGLKSIVNPVLAIQGVEDEYGTELQLDLIVEKCSGNTDKLFIKECGHAPHKQQQQIVLNAVTKFLKQYGDS